MSEQQRQNTHFHSTPKEVFESMIEAANRHDLETMVACFAPDYRSELPLALDLFRGLVLACLV
jgi:hypothetical protein